MPNVLKLSHQHNLSNGNLIQYYVTNPMRETFIEEKEKKILSKPAGSEHKKSKSQLL